MQFATTFNKTGNVLSRNIQALSQNNYCRGKTINITCLCACVCACNGVCVGVGLGVIVGAWAWPV